MDERIKTASYIYTYNRILLRFKEGRNIDICDHMDDAGEQPAN
jgi:hypothetical protein